MKKNTATSLFDSVFKKAVCYTALFACGNLFSNEATIVQDTEIQGPIASGNLVLTLEATHSSATLPRLEMEIPYGEVDTQIKTAQKAYRLAEVGWNLPITDNSSAPPAWSGPFIAFYVGASQSQSFGYDLNDQAQQYSNSRFLVFHTDDDTARGAHDICESPGNYGVVSGVMSGVYVQCAVSDWGAFRLNDVNGIEPTIELVSPNTGLELAG
ncbi:MAG: hypothetical protein MK188_00005, partial [Gammaproteobacteria bacterium]|nr:hypothetical protein [Gammaproteobacteria bacterium]